MLFDHPNTCSTNIIVTPPTVCLTTCQWRTPPTPKPQPLQVTAKPLPIYTLSPYTHTHIPSLLRPRLRRPRPHPLSLWPLQMLCRNPPLIIRSASRRCRRVSCRCSRRSRFAGGATGFLCGGEEGFEPGCVDEIDGSGEEGCKEGVEEEPARDIRLS
jgi:hypothetical protein